MDAKKLCIVLATLIGLILFLAQTCELAYLIHATREHHSALRDVLGGRPRLFPRLDRDRCPCAAGECDCCRCLPQRPGRGSLGDLDSPPAGSLRASPSAAQ